eukprot:1290119-Amphidinium_carterae.1
MVKTLVLRSLTHSGFPRELWSCAALYAAQSLLCTALLRYSASLRMAVGNDENKHHQVGN